MVATDQGELLLVNYNGQLSEKVTVAQGQKITCMTAHSRGIIVGGENGKVWIYELVSSDINCPLRLMHTNNGIKLAPE